MGYLAIRTEARALFFSAGRSIGFGLDCLVHIEFARTRFHSASLERSLERRYAFT
jgi:hypothetical protein